MAYQTYSLVNLLRRLVSAANDALDNFPTAEDEHEPGQQSGIGNVALRRMSLDDPQERSRTDLCIVKGDCFRENMKEMDAVLLDIYNSNGLYLCERQEMEAKIRRHMRRTGAYAFIEELNKDNPTCIRQQLDSLVERVTTLLDDLLARQWITESHFYQMTVDRSMVRMDYGCFLPDPSQEGVPFRPFMVGCLGPLMGIARFVSRLLQPIYDEVARSTTFFQASDAVHAVELYADKHLLKPTTLFATFHVNDLCTLLPHEETIEVLERFLKENTSKGHIQGLSIHTIIELVRLVLKNQVFLFRKRVYKQIKGAIANSPLTHLLANIYMFYWQADLVRVLNEKNEVFGRCLDDVFLTWNGSNGALRSLLNTKMANREESMPITLAVGRKISYLNAKICHTQGKLKTKIDHDRDVEPRLLPSLLDHEPLMYATLIRASLIRAVLCCSTLSDFQEEHRNLEDTFFSNGLRSDYIAEKVNRFFGEFNAVALTSQSTTQDEYMSIRRGLNEYEQQQTEMKIQQRMQVQGQELWYIPSPLNGKDLLQLKEDFQRLWEHYLTHVPQLHDVSIEMVGHPKYPVYTK